VSAPLCPLLHSSCWRDCQHQWAAWQAKLISSHFIPVEIVGLCLVFYWQWYNPFISLHVAAIRCIQVFPDLLTMDTRTIKVCGCRMECVLHIYETCSSKASLRGSFWWRLAAEGRGRRLPFISTKSTPVQARSVFCISARISRVLEQTSGSLCCWNCCSIHPLHQIKGIGLQEEKNKRILRPNRKKKNHTTEELL